MNQYRFLFLLSALCAPLPSAQAGELGRLFYTPQQRQQLEYQVSRTGEATSGGRGYIIVNGVVQKQGGRRTVWINGVPQDAGRSDDETPANVSVAVPGKSQSVRAKVGQRLSIEPPPPEDKR